MASRCHDGACHDTPTDCGPFGWLCTECFRRVLRILKLTEADR